MRNLLEHRASSGSAEDGTVYLDDLLFRLPKCSRCRYRYMGWQAMRVDFAKGGLVEKKERTGDASLER